MLEKILLIGFVVLFIAAISFVIYLQCKRVRAKKEKPVITENVSKIAREKIDQTVLMLNDRLTSSMKQKFQNGFPENAEEILDFIAEFFAERFGKRYVSIEALSMLIVRDPHISLNGADSVGGLAVMPIKIEQKEKTSVFLDGLSISYRNNEYVFSETYRIRFSIGGSEDSNEQMLYFERT